MSKDSWLLLYDGECELCVSFVLALQNLGPDVLICRPYQLHQGEPLIALQELQKVPHLIAPDGRIFTGPQAMEQIVLLLPAAKPLIPMIYKPALSSFMHWFYRLTSWMRLREKPCPHCPKSQN